MTAEQFDSIITALRFIIFALGCITGIELGRWLLEIIDRSK